MTATAQRWVVLYLGETLVDETENWGAGPTTWPSRG